MGVTPFSPGRRGQGEEGLRKPESSGEGGRGKRQTSLIPNSGIG